MSESWTLPRSRVDDGAAKSKGVSPGPPIVRYAPLGELKVYEISEAELKELENGPPGQVDLSIALALLPAALSVFITIQTGQISDTKIYYVYWIAFWLLSIQGLIPLVRWWNSAGTLKSLIQDIRSRMPEKPGIPEQATTPTQGSEKEPKDA